MLFVTDLSRIVLRCWVWGWLVMTSVVHLAFDCDHLRDTTTHRPMIVRMGKKPHIYSRIVTGNTPIPVIGTIGMGSVRMSMISLSLSGAVSIATVSVSISMSMSMSITVSIADVVDWLVQMC